MLNASKLVKCATVVALGLSSLQAMAETFTFKVTAAGGKYSFNGQVTPVVKASVGDTLVFDVSDISGHPFYITEKADSRKPVQGAVSSAASSTLTLNVSATTPKNLFYSCTRHANMGGKGGIQVVD